MADDVTRYAMVTDITPLKNGEWVRYEDYAALAAELERVQDDAARWQQAAKQAAAWVMCTPQLIAQMQEDWSEPVCLRITRRVAEDVLEFEAKRYDAATTAEEARCNLLVQTVCRLPDAITLGDWERWLEEHRGEWLSDDRAFGGWLHQQLRQAIATARADALREARERVLQLDRYGHAAPDVVLSRVVLGEVLAAIGGGE